MSTTPASRWQASRVEGCGLGGDEGGSAKVQIGRRPVQRWKGKTDYRVQITEYRFQKYEDANFPFPGSPFRLYAVGSGLRPDIGVVKGRGG
jgi:hypothetical protein